MTKLPLLLILAVLAIVVVSIAVGEPFSTEEYRPYKPTEPAPEPAVVEAPPPPPVAPVDPAPPTEEPCPLRESLKLGHKWLAAHQAEDGSWSSESDDESRPAVTGLVLLAFLDVGETHKHGSHKTTVKAGLKYLKTQQRPDGGFGPYERSDYAANDTIATLAMCEAYGMTGSPLFKQSAQLGVDHVAERGISRFWDVLALASAGCSGLRVPETWKRDALIWLDSVTDAETGAATWSSGGMVPHSPLAQTAAAAWGRILIGAKPESDAVVQAFDLVAAARPQDHFSNPGLVYFGTNLAFQATHRRGIWRAWVRTTLGPVGETQEPDGSWKPTGTSARLFGRVGVTAIQLQSQVCRTWYRSVFRHR